MGKRNKIADYEESLYYDYDESNKGKVLTKKEIEQEDYTRLIVYLETYFIPSTIRYKKTSDLEGEFISYIWFSNLINWNFCKEEIAFIIKYLKEKGIAIYSKEANIGAIGVPDKDFFLYKQIACSTPLLAKDYQIKLLEEYRKSGNKEIRNQLLLSNLRLVYFTLKTFLMHKGLESYKVSLRDLEEAGIDALFKALDSYRSEFNCSFRQYAFKVIYYEFYNYFVRKMNKKNLMENFNEARLIIEEREGVKLVSDLTMLDDILDYMVSENKILAKDYEKVKQTILKVLKKYYSDLEAQFVVDNSDSKLDDESLAARILKFIKPYPSCSADLEILSEVFGFQGDPISERQLATKVGISKSRINARIRRIEQHLEESPDIAKIFGDEALEYYQKK